MTVDLVKYADKFAAAFPGWSFSERFRENYETRRHPNGDWYLACKRCGMDVWSITKHDRNVHGDDIADLPPRPENVARGWLSDEQGRRVIR
jgi:hypothetical protein